MRADALIPSKFLSASDLQGREFVMTIARIGFEEIDKKQKPILYFVGAQKGLALNKTNINNLTALYGGETDDWTGKQVTLFEAMVDFQGKSTPAIRIKAPPRAQANPPQRQQFGSTAKRGSDDPISSGFPGDRDLNDDIPL